MTDPLWQIENDTTHGTSFRLTVGAPGIPGSHCVSGLSIAQAEALGHAVAAVEERAAWRALQAVRSALGIQSN